MSERKMSLQVSIQSLMYKFQPNCSQLSDKEEDKY